MDVTNLIETNLTLDIVKLSQSKKLVLLGGGTMKTMPDGKGKLSLLVEIDGKQINWIPNKTTLKHIAFKYGTNSDNWVGKVIGLEIGVINGKEAVIGKPLESYR